MHLPVLYFCRLFVLSGSARTSKLADAHNYERAEELLRAASTFELHRILLEPGVRQTLDCPAEGYCTRRIEIGYLAELAGMARAEAGRVVD